MKLGGGCLRDGRSFLRAANLLKYERFGQTVVVVSAVSGVTDLLESAIQSALATENGISDIIKRLNDLHTGIVRDAIIDQSKCDHLQKLLQPKFQAVERMLYGISYTGEVTESVRVTILSQGERLAAIIFAAVLAEIGKNASAFEADRIGIVTDSAYDNATAILPEVRKNIKEKIVPLMRKGIIPVITGFFGQTREGKTSSFGRNGSDYSAAVIAHALEASEIHIWKDVDGFMTADPKLVPTSRSIKTLSYFEAAELSYFGARILHPRTVEPLVGTNTRIHIRNINSPENTATIIVESGKEEEDVIKSVTFNGDISVLRVRGAGVGHKPGIIGTIGRALADANINIFSVLTAQTCINLLLDNKDAVKGIDALRPHIGGVIDSIELRTNVALIAVVGEGLLIREGLAARVFSAVAKKSINVEMFAAGASDVAYYFIVARDDMEKAVTAVHDCFFGERECS